MFDEAAETMPHGELRALQSTRLGTLARYVYQRVPFYKDAFDAAGVDPASVRSIDDVARLPITRKSDLHANYPTGLFAVPKGELARIHASSGTTGKPTIVGYTANDLDLFAQVNARCLAAAGATPGMVFHNAYGYGLFTGGLGLHGGAEARAAALAAHLLKGDENEHVTVHEIRGFIAQDVLGALQEAEMTSLATMCRQYLFSLSLNPPEEEVSSVEDFENAIDRIEKSLGLEGQPRGIVFHEKKGRRHCHCVWSRIYDAGHKLKAVQMSHFKNKLFSVAKELFIHHGWKLPKGFLRKEDSSPTNYTLHEWQQAERLKDDPVKLKAFFQTCWNGSDNK